MNTDFPVREVNLFSFWRLSNLQMPLPHDLAFSSSRFPLFPPVKSVFIGVHPWFELNCYALGSCPPGSSAEAIDKEIPKEQQIVAKIARTEAAGLRPDSEDPR